MTDLLKVHFFSESDTDDEDEKQAIARANSYCGCIIWTW